MIIATKDRLTIQNNSIAIKYKYIAILFSLKVFY